MEHTEIVKRIRQQAQNYRDEASRLDGIAEIVIKAATQWGQPQQTVLNSQAFVSKAVPLGLAESSDLFPETKMEAPVLNGLSGEFPYQGTVEHQIDFVMDGIGRGAHHSDLDPLVRQYRPDISDIWLSSHLSTLFRKKKIHRTKLGGSNNRVYYFKKAWITTGGDGTLALKGPEYVPQGGGITKRDIATMVIE